METPHSRASGDPLVVIKDVQKHYGDFQALKDINLTIGRGEVVVVIGPSGSGKSTLCRAINRLETITSGSVSIDVKELRSEEHTYEIQSLMRISYAVFCLKKQK